MRWIARLRSVRVCSLDFCGDVCYNGEIEAGFRLAVSGFARFAVGLCGYADFRRLASGLAL